MAGGWLWVVAAVVAVLLGAALWYGMTVSTRRGRNREAERGSEEATRRLYDQESRGDEPGRHAG
jgi:hypothetical protein